MLPASARTAETRLLIGSVLFLLLTPPPPDTEDGRCFAPMCAPCRRVSQLDIDTNAGDGVDVRSACTCKSGLKTSITGEQSADGVEMGFR